jgi:hypothetical protein
LRLNEGFPVLLQTTGVKRALFTRSEIHQWAQ